MSYDENRISDLIDGGLAQESELQKLAIEAVPAVFHNSSIEIFKNDTAQNRKFWVLGYKAAQSKPADEEFLMFLVDTVWSHIYEDESVPSTPLAEDLILTARAKYKDFKTQQAIYKNYPNLNASKEEIDEMRKLK